MRVDVVLWVRVLDRAWVCGFVAVRGQVRFCLVAGLLAYLCCSGGRASPSVHRVGRAWRSVPCGAITWFQGGGRIVAGRIDRRRACNTSSSSVVATHAKLHSDFVETTMVGTGARHGVRGVC